MEGRVSLWIPEQNMCITDRETHVLIIWWIKKFTAVSSLFVSPLLSLLTGRGLILV